LRQAIQRTVAESVARANPPRVAAGVPAAIPLAPAPSGKRRVAITEPREIKQPALNAFSRTLTDALRGSLDREGGFILVDQDSVRGAVAQSPSRDDLVTILQPDVLISPTHAPTIYRR